MSPALTLTCILDAALLIKDSLTGPSPPISSSLSFNFVSKFLNQVSPQCGIFLAPESPKSCQNDLAVLVPAEYIFNKVPSGSLSASVIASILSSIISSNLLIFEDA